MCLSLRFGNVETKTIDMTYNEADVKIRELINDEFLATLLEVGKLYGWTGDYVEIGQFIENLHAEHGIEGVDVQPYELEED